jgi:sarcosine oxidase
MRRYDAIVLGLGAAGSAALYQLARRGARVLGLDRHAPPHAFGSTHGDTRVTRLAIGEGAHYTPLALRSHEIWRELERETGETLLTSNGGLIISSPNKRGFTHVDEFFANTVAAAEEFGIAHERLDAGDIRARFPEFAIARDEYGYFERDAGFVRPEAAVRAQLALARERGAEMRVNERVSSFVPSPHEVTVTTDKGVYTADKLIVAAGPWLPQLLAPEHAAHFSVYRQVLYWFDIDGPIEPFLPERFPVFIWELRASRQGIYGFPAIDGPGGGLKIATEQYIATTSPDNVAREVGRDEIADMHARFVAPYFPHLSARCVRAATCLYTVTTDFAFVVDRHPDSDRVILASPCSGHGFKHSAALGEAMAQLVLEGRARFDLSPFAFSRLSGRGRQPSGA